MASKKKESESIALLSMYGDEDDDMEDDTKNDDNAVQSENKEQTEVGANMEEDDSESLNNNNIMGYIYGGSIRPVVNLDSANDYNTTPESIDDSTQPPPPGGHSLLPKRPTAKCSVELQEKFIKFLSVEKKTGRSFNSEMRNRKAYRNPDFMTHVVIYQNIEETGSCFFHSHGCDKSDFYDEIEPAVDIPNKKSKWDKVDDGDRRHHVTTTGQDSVGYTAFAQQRQTRGKKVKH